MKKLFGLVLIVLAIVSCTDLPNRPTPITTKVTVLSCDSLKEGTWLKRFRVRAVSPTDSLTYTIFCGSRFEKNDKIMLDVIKGQTEYVW